MNLRELIERFANQIYKEDPYEGGAGNIDELLDVIENCVWTIQLGNITYDITIESMTTEEDCRICAYGVRLDQTYYCGLGGTKKLRQLSRLLKATECSAFVLEVSDDV